MTFLIIMLFISIAATVTGVVAVIFDSESKIYATCIAAVLVISWTVTIKQGVKLIENKKDRAIVVSQI